LANDRDGDRGQGEPTRATQIIFKNGRNPGLTGNLLFFLKPCDGAITGPRWGWFVHCSTDVGAEKTDIACKAAAFSDLG